MNIDNLVNAALRRLAHALSVDVARHMREMRGLPGDVLEVRRSAGRVYSRTAVHFAGDRVATHYPDKEPDSLIVVLDRGVNIATFSEITNPWAAQSLEWLGVPGRWVFESVEATPERNIEVKLCEVSL